MHDKRSTPPGRAPIVLLSAALLTCSPALASPPGKAAACAAPPIAAPAQPERAANPIPARQAIEAETASLKVTQPLSPTALNIFNFGSNIFKVKYPPGTKFPSPVNMTVTAAPISQMAYAARVAGTPYANSLCITYDGEAGNCIDYQITCSDSAGPVTCPTTTAAPIDVWTTYDTTQSIVNPGFLYAPLGTNRWGNKFDDFFLLKIDPTAHGHTNGFSEFVSTALGATNQEGLGEFSFNAPLRPNESRTFPTGSTIPISFHLGSTRNCGNPVTDAVASMTVLEVVNSAGKPTSITAFVGPNVFKYEDGNYVFNLSTARWSPGSYAITIYGNAFETQSTYFYLDVP